MVTQFYQPDVKRSRDCCLQCYVILPWVEKKDAHATFLSDWYVLKWGAVELSTTAAIFRETEGARGGYRTPYTSTIILNRSNSTFSARRSNIQEIPYWSLSRREMFLSLCLQCRWLNAVIIALLFGLKLAFTFPISRWLLLEGDKKLKSHNLNFCYIPCTHLGHCYQIQIPCWKYGKICLWKLQNIHQITDFLLNHCLLALKQPAHTNLLSCFRGIMLWDDAVFGKKMILLKRIDKYSRMKTQF